MTEARDALGTTGTIGQVPDALRAAAEVARLEALALLEKGEFAPALEAYDRAVEAANATQDPAFADWMFVCRAAASAELGAADKELVELKCVLLRTLDAGTSFRAAYTAARIYEIRRELGKARAYNVRARQSAETLGDLYLLASAENQAGNVLSADSRFADAIEAYTRALALAERCDSACGSISETYRSIWRNNLGYCLIAADRLEEGLPLVHGSLDFFEKAGAKGYSIVPLVDLCFAYLKLDRWAEARYFGEEALARLSLGEDAGDRAKSDEKNVLYLLGEACHLAGDAEAARGYFDLLARLYPDFKNLRSYLEVFDFRNVINLRS
jgi:tetratricopeptide (TPR) repeat protein